ncbi:MAG: AraC family transcriptional regulator [Bacteroidota bacterium]
MTVSSAIVRDIVHFSASYEVDKSSLCHQSGILLDYLDSPDHRVSLEELDRLWQRAVLLTDDHFLGLHLGQQFNFEAIGVVGYLMQNSPNLGAALQQAQRYSKIVGDVLDIRASQQGNQFVISFDPVPAWQMLSELSLRQSVEYDMAFALRSFEILTGQSFQLTATTFTYQTREPTVYQHAFGTEVQFEQAHNTMAFPCHYLDRPLAPVHSGLLSTLEQFAQNLLQQLTRQESVSNQVKELLVRQVGSGTPEVAAVADQLHMSKRTLQRKLQEEGQSFQKISDEVRTALAKQYLQQGGLSIGETAYLTGFSESAAFHRFFKQQTGKTPQTYQQPPKHNASNVQSAQ